jgi:chaperonin GroES
MATQMPIDQEFDRNIDGMESMTENEDGSVEVPFEMDDSQIEELPDGSAVVTMEDGFKGPSEDEDFYSNLAEDAIDSWELDKIAMRYTELLEKDKSAREQRDKQYEEGIRRTGMGNDAPGGANFMGASKVVHPVMAEACVDFASRAIKELFPPDGPTRTKILGDVDKEKLAVAERKRDYMNWQLTEQIEEFRDEQEQLLTQLPLGGSQFMKLWYDEQKRRPCAEFVPIDNILLPFAAANFYTAQRVTEVQDITDWEFKRRIASGLYRDVDYVRASVDPEESKAEKANNKIEGRKSEDNEDGIRRVFHIYTWLELDDDPRTKGEMAPYIMMIDEYDNQVVGLYRNWEEGDETYTKLDWLIEFKFIPWRGAYAVGLPHLIGGLAAALTGSLRALLDSAHINNSATMLKLKGAKISGQSQQVEVTQVVEIEGAPGVDDIKKIAMPMPFNQPSPVLFQLMGYLDKAAKGVVTTAEEKIADITSNAPVGTTQALIEQGAAVFSAIHARLHDSQSRVLKVLGRLNRWYLDDQKKGDVVADLEITKEDFRRNTDVVPISDPHIFSETQRMAQMQAVLTRSEKRPELYNLKAVEERFLKQIKIPAVNEILKNTPDPEKRDPANENVAMALGQAAFAYIDQDHLAHIQSHLDFAKDPIMGGNPLMAPAFIPQVMEHLKQHLTLWYLNRMNGYVTKAVGHPVRDYEDEDMTAKVDKLYAVASQHVNMDTQTVFQGILPIIQQMQQQLQQMQPTPPLTPEAKVLMDTSMAETQRRAAKDQADIQLAQKKQQDQIALAQEDNQLKLAIAQGDNETKERIESARLARDTAKLQHEQAKTAISLTNQGNQNGYQ